MGTSFRVKHVRGWAIFAELWDETAVIVGQANKTLNLFHGCWSRKFGDGLELGWRWLDDAISNHVTQILNLGLHETTLGLTKLDA